MMQDHYTPDITIAQIQASLLRIKQLRDPAPCGIVLTEGLHNKLVNELDHTSPRGSMQFTELLGLSVYIVPCSSNLYQYGFLREL